MAESESEYRVYVACLASYNNGVLHGKWIDAEQSAEDIQAAVNAMLRASPFPNVLVLCPNCEGDAADDTAAPGCCDVCKGKGKVPSAEEWAIHDYELGGIKISEYESFETVAALAEALSEHGDAFVAFWNNGSVSGDVAAQVEGFQDAYRGSYRSVEEYAEELLEDMGTFENASDTLRNYFDYESFARDLVLGGDIWTEPGGDGVFVFANV